jgi:tRNA A37 threonylcarbamoyladenosine biosynthesis protein TsaE
MQTVITNSVEETLSLGRDFGAKLKGGEVIEFVGDLGAGKTSFMRGLAEGLESKDSVASPTFTLSNIYRASRRPELAEGSPENLQEFIAIHHFDFSFGARRARQPLSLHGEGGINTIPRRQVSRRLQ